MAEELPEYTEAAVIADKGVTPDQIPDLKGIEGDDSDHYPGVRMFLRGNAITQGVWKRRGHLCSYRCMKETQRKRKHCLLSERRPWYQTKPVKCAESRTCGCRTLQAILLRSVYTAGRSFNRQGVPDVRSRNSTKNLSLGIQSAFSVSIVRWNPKKAGCGEPTNPWANLWSDKQKSHIRPCMRVRLQGKPKPDNYNVENNGCSQRDNAEHEGYAKASRSFNRIWKERDSAQPRLFEGYCIKITLTERIRELRQNKGAPGN